MLKAAQGASALIQVDINCIMRLTLVNRRTSLPTNVCFIRYLTHFYDSTVISVER